MVHRNSAYVVQALAENITNNDTINFIENFIRLKKTIVNLEQQSILNKSRLALSKILSSPILINHQTTYLIEIAFASQNKIFLEILRQYKVGETPNTRRFFYLFNFLNLVKLNCSSKSLFVNEVDMKLELELAKTKTNLNIMTPDSFNEAFNKIAIYLRNIEYEQLKLVKQVLNAKINLEVKILKKPSSLLSEIKKQEPPNSKLKKLESQGVLAKRKSFLYRRYLQVSNIAGTLIPYVRKEKKFDG